MLKLLNFVPRCHLAGIRFLALSPCARCFVRKDQIPEMGGKRDMKRRQKKREDTPLLRADLEKVRADIYLKGLPSDGVVVESRLRETSS